ncbi:hypothetical protein HYT23_05020 [Candidatus Pacearchaeota archaeon]|nr:hypothetical protein [Candidatus Pacearchaeota archaeon]
MTFRINWGDGTTDSSYTGVSGFSNPTHTYSSIGNWNPILTVTDLVGQKTVRQLYNPSSIKPPVLSNVNCPSTFTRTYQTNYITCTFKIDSQDGYGVGYTIDWEGDGVIDYTTDGNGLLSGQTHTRSKACSTSICSAGTWATTIRARTKWWAEPVVKTIVVS